MDKTYKCDACKKKKTDAEMSYERDRDAKTGLCVSCNSKRWEESKGKGTSWHSFHVKQLDSYGGEYMGYNHGLDATVENRGHWNRLQKEKGVTHVG